MNQLEILKQLEHFYDAIHPAYENNADVYVWFSTVPHPFLNVVIRLSSSDVIRDVDRLIACNSPYKPMSFWVHPHNRAEGLVDILKERNFISMDIWPVMTWNVKPARSSEADIRRSKGDDFYDVLSSVYQLDEEVKRGYPKLMAYSKAEYYTSYIDGMPVSTASLLIHGQIGEIFNDATLPGRREASFEMMRFLMCRSSELGLKRLITLSSPEAEELHTTLGFEKAFDIEVYAKLA